MFWRLSILYNVNLLIIFHAVEVWVFLHLDVRQYLLKREKESSKDERFTYYY
ncbi:hypothetical protein PEC730217_31850 [Pectobacterium carotovorum subsp. carotovorum]|nr:hypothetical protein PEC730217_31850 [Pectobacterium carotovorum subsp. carotovorum]